jgi:glycosyltransferase involved in cell wall biosynthesis
VQRYEAPAADPIKPVVGTVGRLIEQKGMDVFITAAARIARRRSDVPVVLREFSVFVSSSRWEGMPYALLEALAARRPVVATRVLGSEELIQNEMNGLIVPPANPVALSDAILRLLDDRAFAHRLAEAGRQLVEREYNQVAMAQQIAQVYQRALNRHSMTSL